MFQNMNIPMTVYLALAHVAALVGCTLVPESKWQTNAFALALWPLSGLGITAGAHRLWSHRSYKAGNVLKGCLMLLNSIANQGSIYHWSRDHRVHHKHSDTHADPHNASRGFFFSHVGWLLTKKHPDVIRAGQQLDFSDLRADPFVMFQKSLDPWLNLFMCFVFPTWVCVSLWDENAWNGLLVAGALRYVFVLHCTWCVNSVAHLYGSKPYDPNIYPSENAFVSILAIGEGWHNWHHKYPFDYAASEFGISERFNPTKLFIDTMIRYGLASEPKSALDAWNRKRSTHDKHASSPS
jgi:stearoyl-CoA desaturase (delta-9 desaturase)